ncbi:hypothetical protein [Kitasatospora sp. NPDC056181]|uniref:hypothetical protein n=1 Tax=Kitasatospora sp. NPDC056181 TaxID=3345737 RepID=UPI0035D7CD31
MCNPRRVVITAAHKLAEAWEIEVERTARLSSDVTSELTVTLPFGSSLGPATRVAFESGLRTSGRWSERGAEIVLSLNAAEVRYHPADGTLRVVARLSDTVDTAVTTRLRDAGTVTREISGHGEGRYDPDTRRRSEADARRDAQAKAEADLAAKITAAAAGMTAAARSEQDRAEQQLGEDAQTQADLRVAEQHRTTEREKRRELDERNRARLDDLRDEALLAVNSVLADAYRRAVVDYARAHGAVDVDQREGDGVIDIQFEIEG